MADDTQDTQDQGQDQAVVDRDRGLHRHGDPDPSQWNEQETVTDRPGDPVPENSTFATRAKARQRASRKQVDEAENKTVDSGETKSKRRSSRKD